MKINIKIILLLFICNNYYAQIKIQFLNDVPESFKQKYYSNLHEYNPMHVGDMWQYYFEDNIPHFVTTRTTADTIINGKEYFKKINWRNIPGEILMSDYVSWERNDFLTGISYMLDFEDIDEDSDSLEEFPIDSLELPKRSYYISYKYSYKLPPGSGLWAGLKTALLTDSSWVFIELFNDTVMYRKIEYLEMFLAEWIADKYGIFMFWRESPVRGLTGAIINGKTYGTIVPVEDKEVQLPGKIILYSNYPNPFNPETKISYYLPNPGKVSLIVYDVLGREIATLIDEEKPAGNYSVEFNGADLPSGIYFYQLKANGFTQTKKMLLVK